MAAEVSVAVSGVRARVCRWVDGGVPAQHLSISSPNLLAARDGLDEFGQAERVRAGGVAGKEREHVGGERLQPVCHVVRSVLQPIHQALERLECRGSGGGDGSNGVGGSVIYLLPRPTAWM